MKGCHWCGIVAYPMATVPVWETDIGCFVEHFVCPRCAATAWELYRAFAEEQDETSLAPQRGLP